MKRVHLFEVMDQGWCPQAVRDALLDYLEFASSATKPYGAIVPVFTEALRRTDATRIIDLGSGAAGPWFWLQPVLAEMGLSLTICLTDKHPTPSATAVVNHKGGGAISYHPEPVDATRVPRELTGFRTMFLAFHHLLPKEAGEVLRDAVRRRQGIAVFEATERSVIGLLVMWLAPVMVLILTPLVRPFRWSRLFWTYVIPLVPLIALFDGVVSSLRTYSPKELQQLTSEIGSKDYQWEIGSLKIPRSPIPITYLIGIPV